MQYTAQVENPSKVTRKLTITVPASEVETLFKKGLTEVQKKAKLKGFRPGMAPISVIQQYYGNDVRYRVLNDVIDRSYQAAVRDHRLHPVGQPKIEERTKGDLSNFKGDQDVTYVATVEVMPEVELKTYQGLKVTQTKVAVTDEDVDQTISHMRDHHAEIVVADHETAQKGDFADIEFEGGLVTDGGIEKKEGMSGRQLLELGSGQFIEGFEENVTGLKRGEAKTFRVKFPNDYHSADFAGKEAEFAVKVNEIKTKKLPEVNDEFAKDAGYESVADMREKLKEGLRLSREEDSKRKLKNDLIEQLIEKNPFDVPQALIHAQMRVLVQEVVQMLKGRGLNDDGVQEILKNESSSLMQRAENQVRAGLLLDAVAKEEKIEVAASDLDQELEKMAKAMNMDLADVRGHYEKDERRKENLEFRVKEEKTLDRLLEKAKLK